MSKDRYNNTTQVSIGVMTVILPIIEYSDTVGDVNTYGGR